MTAVRRSPLIVAVLCGAAVAGLTILVKTTPYIPLDDAVLRAIQSLDIAHRTGWTVVGLIALLVAVSRVYVGAHWPLDVLASLLVAFGWVCLVASIRRISDPAFRKN